ncbi:hypothetical protein PARC_a0308 [Pseudoalteromonas arctica A 37-1-2]|uniref:Uncharacterized protein n=1 Tax=Pseudoalteromonas arctica A 37-1-2 TaxID=1117313 RepID=A0A290RYK9_9GAMM|nr:hypothetical protein PARC_a0308 [Pseudoalteromonas arctica A 37-1-2]
MNSVFLLIILFQSVSSVGQKKAVYLPAFVCFLASQFL